MSELNYCWLYGSENVIKKCYDILKGMSGEKWFDDTVIKHVEELLILMRKDLGLKSELLHGNYVYYRLIYDEKENKINAKV